MEDLFSAVASGDMDHVKGVLDDAFDVDQQDEAGHLPAQVMSQLLTSQQQLEALRILSADPLLLDIPLELLDPTLPSALARLAAAVANMDTAALKRITPALLPCLLDRLDALHGPWRLAQQLDHEKAAEPNPHTHTSSQRAPTTKSTTRTKFTARRSDPHRLKRTSAATAATTPASTSALDTAHQVSPLFNLETIIDSIGCIAYVMEVFLNIDNISTVAANILMDQVVQSNCLQFLTTVAIHPCSDTHPLSWQAGIKPEPGVLDTGSHPPAQYQERHGAQVRTWTLQGGWTCRRACVMAVQGFATPIASLPEGPCAMQYWTCLKTALKTLAQSDVLREDLQKASMPESVGKQRCCWSHPNPWPNELEAAASHRAECTPEMHRCRSQRHVALPTANAT